MECEILLPQKARGFLIIFIFIFQSQVFTLFVEEPSRHLILIRFYDDFVEFDKRVSKQFFGVFFLLLLLSMMDS